MPLTMNPSGEHQTAPGSRRPPARKKGCLIFFAVVSLTVFLGAIRIYHPRFEDSSPSEIEMQAWQYRENKDHKLSIADPSDCRRIINGFKRGTWTMPHMCKARARFKIHYENGAVDHVDFMPGHAGPEFCEIRMGLNHYQLSRKELFQIFGEAGFDTSKIPVD